MENAEFLFQENSWFKKRLIGPDGFFWKKARKMFLSNHDLASALNLFQYNYKALEIQFLPEGAVLQCSKNTKLDPGEALDYRRGQAWADDAKNSIRTLLDQIVTRWKPEYLRRPELHMRTLHKSLTLIPLQTVEKQFGESSFYDHQKND